MNFHIVFASIPCICECCYWHSQVATLVLAKVVTQTRVHITCECDVALNLYRIKILIHYR